MAAYLQMGNDTENLVGETDLTEFHGIVLSPVNRHSPEIAQDIVGFRNKGDFHIIFDPQLYVPNSNRGCLPQQTYFPSDLDTADLSSEGWWASLVTKLASCVEPLGVNAVASPAVLPRAWNDDYYARCVDASRKLSEALSGGINAYTTVMVDYNQMAEKDAALRIASIVSEADSAGYYLVIVSNVEPRREFNGEQELTGIMNLIQQLEGTERPVLVSHCSSDMVLYKAAGASHCATGKFYNLRRFTRSRYEDPSSGGGQLAYWFEHSLLAFLRGADLRRLQDNGLGNLIGTDASDNYWSQQIYEQFSSDPQRAWVRLGWRQYLSWFGKTESVIAAQEPVSLVQGWLKNAEENWLALEDRNVLLDEPRNDGSWIRPWRQALNRFKKPSL